MAKTRLSYQLNPDGTVNVVTADGQTGSLPEAEAVKLFSAQQARPLTPEERLNALSQQRQEAGDYGPAGTFMSEAVRAGTLGLSDVIGGAMATEGATPEGARQIEQERLARVMRQREAHPISSVAGTITGSLATVLGGPVAGAGRIGAGLGARAIGKLGASGAKEIAARAMARGTVEAGLLGAGAGVSEVALTPGKVGAEQTAATIAKRGAEAAAYGAGLQAIGLGVVGVGKRVMQRFRGPEGQQLVAQIKNAKAYQRDKEVFAAVATRDPGLRAAGGQTSAAYTELQAAARANPLIKKSADDIIAAAKSKPDRLTALEQQLVAAQNDLANAGQLREGIAAATKPRNLGSLQGRVATLEDDLANLGRLQEEVTAATKPRNMIALEARVAVLQDDITNTVPRIREAMAAKAAGKESSFIALKSGVKFRDLEKELAKAQARLDAAKASWAETAATRYAAKAKTLERQLAAARTRAGEAAAGWEAAVSRRVGTQINALQNRLASTEAQLAGARAAWEAAIPLSPDIAPVLQRFLAAEAKLNQRLTRNGLEALAEGTKQPYSTLPFLQKTLKANTRDAQAALYGLTARQLQYGAAFAGGAIGATVGYAQGEGFGGVLLGKALGFFAGFRLGPMALGALANRMVRANKAGLSSLVGRGFNAAARIAPAVAMFHLNEVRSTVEHLDVQDTYAAALKGYEEAGIPKETASAIAEYEAGRLKALKDAVGNDDGSFRRTLAAVADPLSVLARADKDESTDEDVKALEAISPAVHNKMMLASQRILDDPETKWSLPSKQRENLELWSGDPEHDTVLASVQEMYRAKLEAAEGQGRAIRGRQMHRPSAATSLDAAGLAGGVGLRG